jgi:hypothetical protein
MASHKVVITEVADPPPSDIDIMDIWISGGLTLKGAVPAGLDGLLTWGEKMRAQAMLHAQDGYPTLGRLALGQERTRPDLRFCLKGVDLGDPAGWFAVFCRPGPEVLSELLAEVEAA